MSTVKEKYWGFHMGWYLMICYPNSRGRLLNESSELETMTTVYLTGCKMPHIELWGQSAEYGRVEA